jgi:hypothetical protein
VGTYIAWEKGTKPKANRNTGLYKRDKALAWITHRKMENVIVLVNKNTSLSRAIWVMGETSKSNKRHQIGGHGTLSPTKLQSPLLTSR